MTEGVALLGFLTLSACNQGADDQIVRRGTMPGFTQTTIGKAFEASFDNSRWSAFETPKGARVVEFKGAISVALHRTAVSHIEADIEDGKRKGDEFGTVMEFSACVPDDER